MRPEVADKLRVMAGAVESPHEATIAAAKLAEAGVPIDPPRPPAPPATGAPNPGSWGWSVGSTNTAVFYWWFRVAVVEVS